MSGEVSTPVWFRRDGDWKHGWGTLNKGQLTIWMHSLMIDPTDFGESLLRRDVRACATRCYKDNSSPPSRAGPQRHPRVIELLPKPDENADSTNDDPSKQSITIAACSAIDFAKWSSMSSSVTCIGITQSDSTRSFASHWPTPADAIDKFSAGAAKNNANDGSQSTRRSRLSPDPEIIALLSCRCPGFLRSFAMARHSLELESARRVDCNIVMAVTILKSMHSNILEIELSSRQAAAGEHDWETQVDNDLPEFGSMQLAVSWLRRMDEYLDGMIQQAATIAETDRTESSSQAACMLLQDIVHELDGVAKAARLADAAGVPATFDDGHAGADAAIASIASAAAAAATERTSPKGAAADTASRRTNAPSVSSTASTCSASSAAVNGRSAANAMALTSALTAHDSDLPVSRSADRTYLNSITQSRGGVQPILSHSVLPYETYWLHARGV